VSTSTAQATESQSIDVAGIRADFPILSREVNGKPLVYLDNSATTQRPEAVIEAIANFYRTSNANVHRGVHTLSEEATDAYEGARKKVASFLNVKTPDSVIFTRNTTESINLVAYSWARRHLRDGDEILLSVTEHHSNLVPWQILSKEIGCKLRFLDIDDDGHLRIDQLGGVLNEHTRLVAISHVSNVLGTINPIPTIACAARSVGAKMLVDGAQGVPHGPVDFSALDCDFYAYSPHKALGPLGIGVLLVDRDLMEEMDPFLGGGEMIRDVTLERSTWAAAPYKFEAGTPSVADAVGLGASIDYLEALGMHNIRQHEVSVNEYLLERLRKLPWLTIFGPKDASDRCGLVTFNDNQIHPHDLGTILDQHGVAIRAGHHCAKPLMRRLGVTASARASFYIYNDRSEVDVLINALLAAREVFGLSA
jgi:cysteine desulfurase/selenocysteine lyase